MTNFDRYYYGFWKNDKMYGKGILEEPDSIFEGEFKNNKKWNGQMKKDNQTYIIKKGKQVKRLGNSTSLRMEVNLNYEEKT